MNNCYVEGYAEGYTDGWNKCRELICKKYNLDIKEVIAWEKSDEDSQTNKNKIKEEAK